MPNVSSPSQSPSSMYSHAPTVIHHSAHRSALARRATRQLTNWAESPGLSTAHQHEQDSPSPNRYAQPPGQTQKSVASAQQDDYSFNGNYSAEYDYSYANDYDAESASIDHASHISAVRSGPTVRNYAELNFEDEVDDAIGYAPPTSGRKERVNGEWGTPESALAGIGRQATRIMRAATTKKTGTTEYTASTKGGKYGRTGDTYERDNSKNPPPPSSHSLSPSNSFASKSSSRQRFGDLLSTAVGGRKGAVNSSGGDIFTSGSKVSIASEQSSASVTTRASSSDSSVGEAVITPNLSSAFTPYYDASIRYAYPSRQQYGSTKSSTVSSATPSAKSVRVGDNDNIISTADRRNATTHTHSHAHAVTPGLAPSAHLYDPATNSNTLSPSPALFSLSPTPSSFAATDRPLLSSGSPGFGLISLEAAQQRERLRLGGTADKSFSQETGPTTSRLPSVPALPTTQSQKLRNKKSLISLFRSATAYATGGGGGGGGGAAPPVPNTSSSGIGKKMNIGDPMPLLVRPPGSEVISTPTPARSDSNLIDDWLQPAPISNNLALGHATSGQTQTQTQNTVSSRSLLPGPKLELRPVSMMLANGLPEDYLATSSVSSLSVNDDASMHHQDGSGRSSVFTASSSLSSAISSAPLASIPSGMDTDVDPEMLALQRELANLKKAHQIRISELSSQVREARDGLEASRAETAELRSERDSWAPKEDGCTACGCTCGMAVSEMLMGSAPSPSPRTTSGRARSGTTATSRSVRSVRSTRSGHSARTDLTAIPIPAVPMCGGEGGGGVMDRARVKTGGARGVFGTGSLYEYERR